jgi:enoyl-CoA hydratase
LQQIDIEIKASGIAVITMTPPKLFMNRFTVEELGQAISQVEANDNVRVVILTGGNKDYFIRHYDVRELEKFSAVLSTDDSFDVSRDQVQERDLDLIFNRMATSSRPYIAAINGNAMGGGFETALACDFRVAQAGDYSLGQPEINIGILPGAGGTQRLARLIGASKALDLCLTGRTVRPDEALSLGMVDRIAENALEGALALAAILAAKPKLAVAHIKNLLRHSVEKPLADALADERTLFRDLITDPDAIALMTEMNDADKDIREMSSVAY